MAKKLAKRFVQVCAILPQEIGWAGTLDRGGGGGGGGEEQWAEPLLKFCSLILLTGPYTLFKYKLNFFFWEKDLENFYAKSGRFI